MKIIIPITQADVGLLADYASLLVHFGGLQDHELVLLAAPSTLTDAHTTAAGLVDSCGTVTVEEAPEESTARIQGGNYLFARAARLMAAGSAPWLWLELDAVPRCVGWANRMVDEYGRLGRPIMGIVRQTPLRDEHNKVTSSSNDMMLDGGCAMFPPWLFRRCEMFNRLGLGPGMTSQPWNFYLRHTLRQYRWAHTDLIESQWRTQNYRMEDGNIVCDPIDGVDNFTFRGGKLRNDAVITHGCRDGSLARMLLSGAQVVESPQGACAPRKKRLAKSKPQLH